MNKSCSFISILLPYALTSILSTFFSGGSLYFLKQVSQYLRSKNWDTRVAAAHAIGAIAQSIKHTSMTELFASVETKMSEAGISGIVEDVVAWPNFHSKIVTSVSFRRLSIFSLIKYLLCLLAYLCPNNFFFLFCYLTLVSFLITKL